jgi:AraC family transcriptional regulator, positive regulator of tynA and feaB
MLQLFSTERLPASDRVDAWQWNARQICGDCRIQLPKSSFHGSIEIRNVDGLPLMRFSSSPLSFRKEPFDTVNADNRACIVITQIAGARHYTQDGVNVLLKAGDSTLIDSGRPWSSTCETDCVRLYLRVPRWMMESRLRMRKIPIAHRICGATGLGTSLSRLSQSLYNEAKWNREEQGATALENYFEVLGKCLRGESTAFQQSSELGRRILQFIDEHVSEPTLGPVEVASAMGISVRHLHRLFSVTGSTLSDHIRTRRLAQCRKDLADPSLHEKTITDIAFFWGFSDAAHFSHTFRKQFGISPRAFRARTTTQGRDTINHEVARDFLSSNVSEFRYSTPN